MISFKFLKIVFFSFFITEVFEIVKIDVTAKIFQAEPGQLLSDRLPKSKNRLSFSKQVSEQTTEQTGKQFVKQDDGKNVILSVFYICKESQQLKQKTISQLDLSKAIIIFWADWCDFCGKLLSDLYVKILAIHKQENLLEFAKTDIIFVKIPSKATLINWDIPDIEDYYDSCEIFSAYKTDENVQTLLIGDLESIERNRIASIPLVIFVKDGKEFARGAGNQALEMLDFSNKETLENFIKIFSSNSCDSSLSVSALPPGHDSKTLETTNEIANKSVNSSDANFSNAPISKNVSKKKLCKKSTKLLKSKSRSATKKSQKLQVVKKKSAKNFNRHSMPTKKTHYTDKLNKLAKT